MQLPRMKHEYPKQSLRYKLMIEVAKTQSQQNLINLARANIVNGYSATGNLLICNVCNKYWYITYVSKQSPICRYMFSIFIIY